VNTASRIETHSESGKIGTTEPVYQKAKEFYEFEGRGLMSVRDIGQMKTYFLVGPRKRVLTPTR
jgi:class 3 adenylate cyclase